MKILKDLAFKLVSDDGQVSTGILIDAKKGLIIGSIMSDSITIYSSKTPHKAYGASMRCKCPNMEFAIYLIDVDLFKSTPKRNWKYSYLLEEGSELFVGGFKKDDMTISVFRTTIISFPKSRLLIDTDINKPYQVALSYDSTNSSLHHHINKHSSSLYDNGHTSHYDNGMIGSPIISTDGDTVGILGEFGMIAFGTILSIFKYMNSSNLDTIEYPSPALLWSYGIRSIMRHKTDNENTYGFFVRDVLSDSYLREGIHNEDIIKKGTFVRRYDFYCIQGSHPYYRDHHYLCSYLINMDT